MKKTKKIFLLFGLLLTAIGTNAQKFFDANGKEITSISNAQDSSYIKSLPKLITLTNLTKSDLRVFKNMMLEKVQTSDLPYGNNTKVVFDKIMADLNGKLADTATSFKIVNLPVSYIVAYSERYVRSYEEFIRVRQEARQFLRIAAAVQKTDTAFYLLETERGNLNKSLLKKDIKNKP